MTRVKAVLEALKYFASKEESSRTCVIVSPLIVCETSIQSRGNVTEHDRFCSNIISTALKSFNMDIDADNVIVNPKENILGKTISNNLEKRVMQCFLNVSTQLQDFIGDRRVAADAIDILESEQLITSIQGFLKNGLGFVDMLVSRKDEPFINTVLGSLVQVIRCAVMTPLSAKYSLSEDTCNRFAHEINLESSLIQSVSKNTRYHLSKLQKPCEEMLKATESGNKSHHFPGRNFVFIAYPLREDIKTALEKFEERLNGMRRAASTMRKMLYEISGYLYRSVINQEADMKSIPRAIPEKLREEIMAVDGVYGMGTIYGRIEVHLKKMEIEKKAVVQRKVCELIDQFKLTQPYRVVSILQEPKKFCFETGRHIECPCPQIGGAVLSSGTLGGFVYDKDGNLYGLTCAHVVHGEHNAQHDVLIASETQGRRLFARSLPEMTISANADNRSLIDIAAVKVKQEIQAQCTVDLKDDDGNKKPSELYTNAPNEIVYENVYKYGAGSNLTRGIISSTDYTVYSGAAESDHLVLIECPPGSDDGPYAKEGDSGSITCMTCLTDIDNHVVKIKAVSMLCLGQFVLEDEEEICMSFLLNKGIEKLKESTGVDLLLPAAYMGLVTK
ncbi:uncharacterized protein LOC123549679 [Mercenaria mercenaria]|uniref:uncharacterized protein LOC123549679 n=1 Tax=Mercenaria mercenaria TaxID=6596 RepID=UPI00234FA923|nr:uncharacterized protein LOC123549679 [Mercenaria mercenaria]